MQITLSRNGFCITTGHFEIDNQCGFYIKLPFIGAGHYGSFGWVWDTWSELKRIERARRS
jgi:hypothetical protein